MSINSRKISEFKDCIKNVSAAVQVEKTSLVAMVRTINIPIVFLLNAMFMVEPEPMQWVGASLVVGAILATNVNFSELCRKLQGGRLQRENRKEVENSEQIEKY